MPLGEGKEGRSAEEDDVTAAGKRVEILCRKTFYRETSTFAEENPVDVVAQHKGFAITDSRAGSVFLAGPYGKGCQILRKDHDGRSGLKLAPAC